MLRRKSSPTRLVARRCFDDLPTDILILVLSQCRIDELLILRLTNSKIRSTIDSCLSTIAPAVARSSFPASTLLLTPPTQYTLRWLKSLIPQHLASVLVDRHRFSQEWALQRYGIPAEDPFGNALRDRVANGWRVLQRLAKISCDVYKLDAKDMLKSSSDLAWRFVNPSRFRYEVFKQREDLILQRRLEYIKDLHNDMAKDYKLMFMLLSSAFRTSISNMGDDYKPWIFDWGCGIDGQRLLRRGNSWLTYFILHEGPNLFWQQWWSLPPGHLETKNYIRDRSIEAWFDSSKITPDDFIRQFLPKEWVDVNEKWHDIQRDYAFKVQKALEEKAAWPFTNFTSVSPIVYFTEYARHRQVRDQNGIAAPPETLSDVPFHVDFRCPEELIQKYCALRQDRATVITSRPRNEG